MWSWLQGKEWCQYFNILFYILPVTQYSIQRFTGWIVKMILIWDKSYYMHIILSDKLNWIVSVFKIIQMCYCFKLYIRFWIPYFQYGLKNFWTLLCRHQYVDVLCTYLHYDGSKQSVIIIFTTMQELVFHIIKSIGYIQLLYIKTSKSFTVA